MKVTTFLIVNTLLVTVLLVWTQLWLTTYQIYAEPESHINLWTPALGLLGLYSGALTSILAIVLSISGMTNKSQKRKPRTFPIFMFSFSIAIVIFEILISMISLAFKSFLYLYYRLLGQRLLNCEDPIYEGDIIGIPATDCFNLNWIIGFGLLLAIFVAIFLVVWRMLKNVPITYNDEGDITHYHYYREERVLSKVASAVVIAVLILSKYFKSLKQ